MRYASFGTVSSGTHRNEDLLESFASELDYHLKRQPRGFKRAPYRKLVREANAMLARGDVDSEEYASDLVDELSDALAEFAPPYAYFGTCEGDGAEFGFWISSDAIEHSFDGLKVSDTSDIPRNYRGEVLHVNDHGNMTLYAASRGKLREVWAVV